MKKYKKIILDIPAMDSYVDTDYLYLIEGRDEEEGYVVARYGIDELRTLDGEVELSALNREVMIETFHEYPLKLCVSGDLIMLGLVESFKVFNMKTKEMTTVAEMRVYDIKVTEGKYAYVSYGADAGLVRYRISNNKLVSPEEQYAFSLSTYVLNDNMVFNEYREDGVNFIMFGCQLPLISMLTPEAKSVMGDGNKPVGLCGKNKLFFYRQKDNVMFRVSDYSYFRKVAADEVVRMPVNVEDFFRGDSRPIEHQGFNGGIIIELYSRTAYIEDDEYLLLNPDPIMSFHSNDKSGIICVIEEYDVHLFIFE